MTYVFDIAYLLVLFLAAPWLIWSAIRKGKYREGWAAKFLGSAPTLGAPPGQRLWFHAVSVGEVSLLAPLLREIELRRPEWHCVLSTTTATGYALARKKYPHLQVFYAPLDFSWAVRGAMRRIQATVLVLIELELWPNLIRAAKANGAKVAIINGRLSQRSFRGYARVGFLTRRVLEHVDLIAAQNDEYAERFRALGARPKSVHVTGSLKFDGAEMERNNEATCRLRDLAGLTDDDVIFLAGSTQAPEESVALATFIALKDEHPRLKLVIVPRNPHRFDEVAALLDRSGLSWRRRSQLEGSGFPPPQAGLVQNSDGPKSQVPSPKSHLDGTRKSETWDLGLGTPRVLLVDTIGELSAWWGAAKIGFVGGSLVSRGGQNMIEPAAYGVAMCFGPNTANFRDIVQMLLARDAAVIIRSGADLTEFVRRCLRESDFADQTGRNGRDVVITQLGTSQRSLSLLEQLVIRAQPDIATMRAA